MTKKVIDIEAGTVTIVFDDGATQAVSLSQLNDATIRRATLHGLSQKMGDSYAGAGKESDPLASAKASVADVVTNLVAGDWRAATTGTGGSRVSDLAKALAELTGKPIEEVVENLAASTEEEVKNFRKHPQVAAKLAQIKAEKAAKAAADAAAKLAAADPSTLTFG